MSSPGALHLRTHGLKFPFPTLVDKVMQEGFVQSIEMGLREKIMRSTYIMKVMSAVSIMPY